MFVIVFGVKTILKKKCIYKLKILYKLYKWSNICVGGILTSMFKMYFCYKLEKILQINNPERRPKDNSFKETSYNIVMFCVI